MKSENHLDMPLKNALLFMAWGWGGGGGGGHKEKNVRVNKLLDEKKALWSMRCPEAESAAETGLKRI